MRTVPTTRRTCGSRLATATTLSRRDLSIKIRRWSGTDDVWYGVAWNTKLGRRR
jgi:hypothetical protein